jgi:hypothetical protein
MIPTKHSKEDHLSEDLVQQRNPADKGKARGDSPLRLILVVGQPSHKISKKNIGDADTQSNSSGSVT